MDARDDKQWTPDQGSLPMTVDPILLIAFIVYLITAISLCPIEIDLDRPYILFNSSFANLKLI